MNKKLLLVLLLLTTINAFAQTVFWSENFNNGCSSNCLVQTYMGANGLWTLGTTGTNGSIANEFFVSCAENGQPVGMCGAGCGNNSSLHVGSVPCTLCLTCPNGDCGAAYNAGPTFIGENPNTHKRAESPLINTVGIFNITLAFKYIEEGEATSDDATVVYSSDGGLTWTLLVNTPKTNNGSCSGQGLWTAFNIPLPPVCENIPNLKIGFTWQNNVNGTGSDPSFAVDDVELSTPSIVIPPIAEFNAAQTIFCDSTCISFIDSSFNNPTSWNWIFTGATPNTSTSQNPMNICYNNAGTYDVTLIVSNGNGTDTITKPGFIIVNPCYLPSVSLTVNDSVLCEKECVDFTDLSTNNPTQWLWLFPGATPDSSSLQNPTGICYNTYGNFTVTLIVTNSSGTDSAIYTSFITVHPDPVQPIVQVFGTVILSSPSQSYQWYFNNLLISGAVNQAYTATQPGNYYVLITDSNGCQSASSQITITDAVIENIDATGLIVVSPNPSTDFLVINFNLLSFTTAEINVSSLEGKLVQHLFLNFQPNSKYVLNIKELKSSFYFLEFVLNGRKFYSKFVKQ